jgi:hypothetical protein
MYAAVHPVPEGHWGANKSNPDTGYWHFPKTYLKPDPHMDELTSTGSFESRYIRLVGGRKHRKGEVVWSRGPDSFITLDGYSVGLGHQWSKYYPEDLAEMAKEHPELVTWAFGEELAAKLCDPKFLEAEIPSKRGFDNKGYWKEEWGWFIAGLYEISRHPLWIRNQVSELLKKPKAGLKEARERGWTREITVAALGRYANSRGNGGMRRDVRRVVEKLGHARELEVIEYLYLEYRDYESRWKKLKKAFSDKCDSAPGSISSRRFNWDAKPCRHDGSVPKFVELELDLTDGVLDLPKPPDSGDQLDFLNRAQDALAQAQV